MNSAELRPLVPTLCSHVNMNYQVTSKLDTNSVELIKELFGCAWWTKDRNSDSIEKMLLGSVCVGVRETEGKLVGFARAITDGVFKALVVDVIVAVDHRRQGICRLLMDALLEHRELSAVRDFELYCQPDLVELYRKWGFQESPNGVTFMRASRAG